MTKQNSPASSLLPVQDRFGLWTMSVTTALNAGQGRAHWSRTVLRRLVVSAAYLALYVGLHGLTAGSLLLPEVTQWNLATGFSLGFLLGYGLTYIPTVLISHMMAVAWLGPGTMSPFQVLALAFSLTFVLSLATVAIRRFSEDPRTDITNRKCLSAFLLLTFPIAMFVCGVFYVNAAAAGLVGWGEIRSLISQGCLGCITGILFVSPLIVLSSRWFAPWLNRVPGRRKVSIPTGGRTLKMYLWRIAPLSAVVAVFLYFLVSFSVTDRFALFILASIPLLGAALVFGLHGVALLLAVIAFATIGRTELGFAGEALDQIVFIGVALNALIVGLLVTERRQQQFTLNHQASLLNSVSFATGQLLGMTDQEKNVNAVLEHLVSEVDVERVYVLENRQNSTDLSYPVLWELSTSSTVLEVADKEKLNAVRGQHIRKFADSIEQDQALQFRSADLAAGDSTVLLAAGIQATLILPIFADGRWWGCLGLDQCSSDRLWSDPEISMFRATSRVLGALLAHTNIEQQFRQFTGTIPAVFWIAAPDVLHKTYVSPAYEQIWGRSRESVRENPRSWMAAIYHEDYGRISSRLEARALEAYDEEYRIVRPNNLVRWIRDTAFPVMDSTGQVTRIVGIAQDITPQKEAEERLRGSEEQVRTSLNEKEVLLKEIHHRVKNNLQVISSLLSLQATKIQDEATAEVFKDSQTRVRAMALVHERLYKSADLARIDFSGYVKDITNHLLRSYQTTQRTVGLRLDVAPVSFDIETAIPCALIINELVSNSLKYAFPDGRKGEISVQLSEEEEGEVSLVCSDNGVGLPSGVLFEHSDSLGLQLVNSLTNQLNGRVTHSGNDGTRFEIRFRPGGYEGARKSHGQATHTRS